MSVHTPSIYSGANPQDALFDALHHEVQGEKASSLGRAGRAVEDALARLAANTEPALRDELLRTAAKTVYAYFIQRELCGFRRHGDVIREYNIPKAVLARLGAF